MPNLNELLVAFGKAKQTDLVTANLVGGLWRLGNINRTLADPQFVNENDETWLGKGHEFATQQFLSHVAPQPHPMEKYLSSEFAAHMWAFGLGKVVKTGAGPFTYTCTPMLGAADGDEQPSFSYVEQMRPGANVVIDRMLVGCVISNFEIAISRGPGLANARATVNFMHSGKITEPSGIAMPAETAENLLNAYSLTATFLTEDYVALKTFESLNLGWDNQLRDGFYPSSGQQEGYQIQGRLEYGDRVPTFNYVARLTKDSTEHDKVKALTTGTAVFSLTKDANNSMTVTWQKMSFQTATIGEAEGKVIVQVTGKPLYHSSNGLVTAVVVTPVDGICQ